MWRGRRTSSELRVIMMPGGSGPGAAAPATTVTVGRAGGQDLHVTASRTPGPESLSHPSPRAAPTRMF